MNETEFSVETSSVFCSTSMQASTVLHKQRSALQADDIDGHSTVFSTCRTQVLSSYRRLAFSNLADAMVRGPRRPKTNPENVHLGT
jgi:hypothetical protein